MVLRMAAASSQPPTQLCRFCLQVPAVQLPELGVLGRYKRFCTIEHAALFGLQSALEKELREPQLPEPPESGPRS
jgi:hypothetical protein